MYPAVVCCMLNPLDHSTESERPAPAGLWITDMGNKTKVSFYKPQIGDLWFREALLGDPDTMSYNNAWGGTIPFPEEDWEDWYDDWVRNPEGCFYRYITAGESRAFAGEAAWHYDEERGIYITDVIVAAKCRGRGYGRAGLELLCEAAKKAGITELYDDIAADNPGVNLFLGCGFTEEYRTDEVIMVKKTL